MFYLIIVKKLFSKNMHLFNINFLVGFQIC